MDEVQMYLSYFKDCYRRSQNYYSFNLTQKILANIYWKPCPIADGSNSFVN